MQESWSDLIRQLWWEINPQSNYHGTPYAFDKFDDSKLLTGQGAMAHGEGHYSADSKHIADSNYRQMYNSDRYKYNGSPSREIFQGFPDVALNEEDYNFLKNKKLTPSSIYDYSKQQPYSILNDWYRERVGQPKLDIDKFIKEFNPKNLEFVTSGNTYQVDVPNKNFMWQQGIPFEEQSEYIKNILRNNYPNIEDKLNLSTTNQYLKNPKTRLIRSLFSKAYNSPNIALLDLFYDVPFGRIYTPHKDVRKIYSKDNLYKILKETGFNYKEINEQKLKDMGIRGFRTHGYEDGPINVTFSGKDIKMANTPFQRFANRIPTQTLGKIAEKIMSSPAVKVGGKVIARTAVPLAILEGISSPTATDQQMWDDINRYNLQRGINLLYGGISNGR